MTAVECRKASADKGIAKRDNLHSRALRERYCDLSRKEKRLYKFKIF